MRRSTCAAAVAALLVLAGGRAEAQYQRSGFVAAGQGGVDGSYFKPDFTLAAGYLARFGPAVGAYVGVRTPIVYSRFTPDDAVLLDSLGLSSGTVEGGSATLVESGLELVAGYDTGALGGYGWYGIHYVSETRNDATVTSGATQRNVAARSRSDLGPSYGAGLRFQFQPRLGVFTEWFRGGGFDDRMLRMEGLRFGVSAVF
ncbi:MAG TPA: hypothetical protein VJT67_06995 [Longimicrobiaceae bacterium]|nr:hypothetical protein [Longimicrobiaceae bacterium]